MGLKLRELRTEQHMTQAQLAKLLSVSVSQISRYETGKVEMPRDIIIKISNILSVSTDELLGNQPISIYPLHGDNGLINEIDVAPEVMNTALSQLGSHLNYLHSQLESLQELIQDSKKQMETLLHTQQKISADLQVLSVYYRNLEQIYQALASNKKQ